jgi:hypothetical protein
MRCDINNPDRYYILDHDMKNTRAAVPLDSGSPLNLLEGWTSQNSVNAKFAEFLFF